MDSPPVVSGPALATFLDLEKEGAVLRLRKGFCATEAEACLAVLRAGKWLHVIDPSVRGVWATAKEGATPSRLHREDVLRTFHDESHRAELLESVVRLQQILGDYSQAMCFVAAFFSIFLRREVAVEMVATLAGHDRFVGRRWFDRVAFGTEAFAFLELLQEHDAEVAAHLAKLYVLPEAYTQRWFLALGVNVLPYAHLMDLMDAFLDQGAVVLHRLGLAIVRVCREAILKAKHTGEILTILNQPPDEACGVIVKMACRESKGILLNDVQLNQFRELALNKYRERLVPKGGNDSTRKHTGETDSENDASNNSDSEEEDNPECLQCTENMAELFCAQCNLLVCERCHKKSKKGHDKTHVVEATESWEFDRLVELYKKLKK